MLVGAKHLEDKLSVIAKNSSPNASPVQLSVVSCQLLVVSCQLLVGAKHLEDKLSVIAKNSSPNASPVQLLVVSCKRYISLPCSLLLASFY
ncbi:MAG: hypothetical protein HEQ26_16470 [Dolichospermum sp. DL01]|nr:MAG: hypothetical protein HEQ26_16470 [Dolichospermum sp. DL01]